jgi:N-acetylmuramoyl-L-alanine amidase-like protein
VSRLLLLVVAAVVVALPAAPAAARETSPLRASDFELKPPAVALASGSGAVRSRPLRPGRRFNLVGMRWRGRAEPEVAIRTRRAGGRWTRWTELHAHAEDGPDPGSGEPLVRGLAMPAWVGQADWIQYRMSRRVAGLRLHFVRVTGRARPRARAAQEAQPPIVPRAEWGASQCRPRTAPDHGEVLAAHIHHTVNANTYSVAEAPAVVLAICRYHRNSNGWNDVGYNFLVDRFGTIYEGRAGGIDQAIMGAQAQGFNAQTTGIASIGDHRSVEQTPAAMEAIARLIRWKLPLHGQPTSGTVSLVSAGGETSRYAAGRRVTVQRVLGHRDTNATTCPGAAFYAQLPELRGLVGTLGPVIAARTRLTAALADPTATYRARVAIGGSLMSPEGLPMANQPIEVQTRYSSGWRTVQRVTTGADGTWAGELRPSARRYVRARFTGTPGERPVASPRVLLRVAPSIKLLRPPSRGVRGRAVRVSGRISPRKGRVYQVLQQRIGRSWRTVGVKAVRVRRGRFTGTFVPAFRDQYRIYFVASRDTKTDRAESPRRLLRVTRR